MVGAGEWWALENDRRWRMLEKKKSWKRKWLEF
jgi:hypothetical protein